MCVYIYVCVCIYIYIYGSMCMNTIHVFSNSSMYIILYVSVPMCWYLRLWVCLGMYMYMNMYIYVYVYKYGYMYPE